MIVLKKVNINKATGVISVTPVFFVRMRFRCFGILNQGFDGHKPDKVIFVVGFKHKKSPALRNDCSVTATGDLNCYYKKAH